MCMDNDLTLEVMDVTCVDLSMDFCFSCLHAVTSTQWCVCLCLKFVNV